MLPESDLSAPVASPLLDPVASAFYRIPCGFHTRRNQGLAQGPRSSRFKVHVNPVRRRSACQRLRNSRWIHIGSSCLKGRLARAAQNANRVRTF